MSTSPWSFVLPDVEATGAFGRALGAALEPGLLVALLGDLGAGKTSLAKGAVAAQGEVDEDDVVSPTFVIAVEYPGRVPVLHVDAYRLERGHDLEALGYELGRPGPFAVLVEWAERVEDALPADRLTITLEHDPNGRRVTVEAAGPRSGAILARLRDASPAPGARDLTPPG